MPKTLSLVKKASKDCITESPKRQILARQECKTQYSIEDQDCRSSYSHMSSPCKTMLSFRGVGGHKGKQNYGDGYLDPDELDKVTFDDIDYELDFDVNS